VANPLLPRRDAGAAALTTQVKADDPLTNDGMTHLLPLDEQPIQA
jgi:hypothetical protein